MKEKNLATRAARSGWSKEKLLLASANGGRSAAELGLYFQFRGVRDTLAETEQGAGTRRSAHPSDKTSRPETLLSALSPERLRDPLCALMTSAIPASSHALPTTKYIWMREKKT
jgi:hypothetical protein